MKLQDFSSLKQYDYLVSCLQQINYDANSEIDPINLKCFIYYALNSRPQYQTLDYIALDQQLRSLSDEFCQVPVMSDMSVDLVYMNNRAVLLRFFYRSEELSLFNEDSDVFNSYFRVALDSFNDLFTFCYVIMRTIHHSIESFKLTRQFKKGKPSSKVNFFDSFKDSSMIASAISSGYYCDKDTMIK